MTGSGQVKSRHASMELSTAWWAPWAWGSVQQPRGRPSNPRARHKKCTRPTRWHTGQPPGHCRRNSVTAHEHAHCVNCARCELGEGVFATLGPLQVPRALFFGIKSLTSSVFNPTCQGTGVTHLVHTESRTSGCVQKLPPRLQVRQKCVCATKIQKTAQRVRTFRHV